MASRRYDIVFSEYAAQQLRDIRDKTAQKAIARKIDTLETDPTRRGKPLAGELDGYLSMRAASRYRVIYWVDEPKDDDDEAVVNGLVAIACVGIRKQGDKQDVYEIASKLRSQGRL